MKLEFKEPHPASPIIEVGSTKFLNVPYASALLREIVEQDCYKLDQIPDGSLVFDVGACYGEFGLICAYEKQCEVFMYEPSSLNWQVIRANCRLNESVLPNLNPRIHNCWAAIGAGDSTRDFYYRPGHPAGSGFFVKSDVRESVPVLKLSEQLQLHRGRSDIFNVCVKLDCEGSEHEIFKNDPGWIDLVNIVTMEWHNHDGDYFRDILQSKGFEVTLEGGGPLPHPVWDKSITGGLLFAKRTASRV